MSERSRAARPGPAALPLVAAAAAGPAAATAAATGAGFGPGGRAAWIAGRMPEGARWILRLLDQSSRENRALQGALCLVIGLAALRDLSTLFASFILGLDFDIPLQAASRWASGAPVYPAEAMSVLGGRDLPYLYPPFLLPVLAPFAALPRGALTAAWLILGVGVAIWTCRRLGLPWLVVPVALVWPPFAEGLITGNIQIFQFAAFAALFYVPKSGLPVPRALAGGRDAVNGLLGMAVGVLKVTQLFDMLLVARLRFRAAVLGAAIVALAVAATVPFTGLAIYGEWWAQLQRAADPSWTVGGVPLSSLLGVPSVPFIVAGVVIALVVRGRDSAAWLGIALILAAPSVHGYTFLFLLPALLTLRHDLSLGIAALFLGLYHAWAWWLGVLFVAYLLVASTKYAWLRAAPARSHGSRSGERLLDARQAPGGDA